MLWTQAKCLSKFQSELQIPNVCKSNSNSNFKIEVRKFEPRFTSLFSPASVYCMSPNDLTTDRHMMCVVTATTATILWCMFDDDGENAFITEVFWC